MGAAGCAPLTPERGARPPPAELNKRSAKISITGVRNNKTRVIVEIEYSSIVSFEKKYFYLSEFSRLKAIVNI